MGDQSQARLTFWTVVIGISFLLIVFIVAVLVFRNSTNPAETIVAVLGAVTGVLGTLIGYVAGQSGKEKAEKSASDAQKQLAAVLDKTGEGVYKQAKEAFPELFKE
ncbi:MAG: hypothetical protein JW854_05115 [Actinobacteria bacterium]|nr:hypothetical protein [Actinomycetota bacterium]